MENDNIQVRVKQLSEDNFQDTLRMRRYLHQWPELSEQEYKTVDYICKELQSINVEYECLLNNTAVVAYVRGNKFVDDKCIAIRADIDALPIIEQNEVCYKSKNNGVMHACGHDVHTANLLATIKILHSIKNEFSGTIMCIFQPSEEKYPGGAIRLIKTNLFEKQKVNAIIGCHVSPELQVGQIGLKAENYMASTDELYLTVIGKGGHAAMPQTFINPLQIAAQILVELENFCKKNASENLPSVLTFGRIIGEGQTNIVPQQVELSGTLRTFDEQWRSQAKTKIEQICTEIASQRGGKAILTIKNGYPVLYNNPELVAYCKDLIKVFWGENAVVDLNYRTTADDFAYYSHLMPAIFFRLGTGSENINRTLHTSTFDVEEKILAIAPALMCCLSLNILQNFQKNKL